MEGHHPIGKGTTPAIKAPDENRVEQCLTPRAFAGTRADILGADGGCPASMGNIGFSMVAICIGSVCACSGPCRSAIPEQADQ